MLVTRTCIGCRQRASTVELLRVVAVSQGSAADAQLVVPDVARKLPGRGAWLHLDRACLVQAERRRAFGRALRQPGRVDTQPVRDYVYKANYVNTNYAE